MNSVGCDEFDVAFFHTRGSLSINGFWYLICWVSIFYCSLALAPYVNSLLPSSEPKENTKIWVGWNLFSLLQGCVVPMITLGVLFGKNGLWWHKDDAQFYSGMTVRNAGLLFVTFELSDLLLGMKNQYLSTHMIIHHVTFIILGISCLTTPNICCWSGIHIAILMTQEMSNPFLSLTVFLNNRLNKGLGLFLLWVVRLLFVIMFLLFRIGLNTWGTIDFISAWCRGQVPTGVPAVMIWVIMLGMLVGACMQWLWGLEMFSIMLSDQGFQKEVNKMVKEMMAPMFANTMTLSESRTQDVTATVPNVFEILYPERKKQL